MKLNTREWGSGDRVALLVHGIMSDSRTWRRVGPALAETAEELRPARARDAETLRERGFTLRTVPGAGHTIHRDDFEGFMTALEGWI